MDEHNHFAEQIERNAFKKIKTEGLSRTHERGRNEYTN